MNGDSSLMQPPTGLRIVNPDDSSDQSLSPPPPRGLTLSPTPIPVSSRPLSAAGPGPAPAPAEQRSSLQRQAPESAASSAISPPPSGCDASRPLSKTAAAQRYQYPAVLSDYASRARKLNHRQSMPSTYQAQQQEPLSSRTQSRTPVPQPGSYTRPVSGVYNYPNMASGSGPTPESTYQLARSGSGQPPPNGVGKNGSRAAAATAMYGSGSGSAAVNGPYAERPYRQSSQPNAQSSGAYQSRLGSGRLLGPSDNSYGSNGSNYLSTSPMDVGPLASSEEWKDRGAAVSAKKEVDSEGKATTRMVKKGVKDFNFGRTLGEGSYSTVLAATDRQTSKEYAIKVLDKRHIIKEKKVKYVNIEKDTLNRLTDHPGIVRLYYTFQDERSLYFVLDLASGGELLGVLKKMATFDEECTRFYGAQILDSIEYMHTRGIIHRDLKPENVLLDDQMHVKITDFGTAKILDLGGQFGKVSINNDPLDGSETDRAVSFVGTAEYVSPELLTDKNACKASDLWAFGCIVYQLLAGRPPFKAGNEYQTFQKIVNLEYTFPAGFPPVARDLVQRLLVPDPGSRLAIEQIKTHAFFEGTQWGKGLWKQNAPKLKSYNPSQGSATPIFLGDATAQASRQPHLRSAPPSSNPASGPTRPQPRAISEMAPPSQLDIDWSSVLTINDERILKIGNLVVYSAPAPYSPNSRHVSSEPMPETGSKLSRFFGGTTTKKRQRLVMITSAGRIILAPAGGDKKEAKMIIPLLDADISWKSHMDSKGYTVWCVFTREKHLTFEDSKTNTGDSGSSVRSTQEWLECIERARNFATSQSVENVYLTNSNYSGLNGELSSSTSPSEVDNGMPPSSALLPTHRHMLRKNHDTDGDSFKGRKRFSKRHSKNGLAAVF